MWNLLKNDEECRKLRDLLEDSAAARPDAVNIKELTEAMSAAAQTHIAACGSCQEAAQDLLATREIFKGVASSAVVERPWFATRVMAAIAARERELTEAASMWLAVPRFASRLALASGALLLVASAWLYERPAQSLSQHDSTLAAQESIFEAPPVMNQDDVLMNAPESNP
jgi:bacterioferritin-associated ferredoxin